MLTKKRIILIFSVIILSVLVYVFTPKVNHYFMWQRAAKAVGGFPYQIGLTNVQMYNCSVTMYPPYSCECTTNPLGTPLCFTKLVISPIPDELCVNNYYVTGTPAGGTGSEALFTITAATTAGLTNGGQLIAGGMGPTMMSNGVLASEGGCYSNSSGCTAVETGSIQKFKKWLAGKLSDFIIAGNRNN